MFVSPQLAAKIEAVEATIMREMMAAHVPRVPGAFVATLADGGVATFLRRESPMNKLIGLGLRAPPDDLTEIERRFAAVGEPVRAEVATLAAPETHAALTARGYQLLGFENALVRRLDELPRADPAIEVARVTEADLPAYRALALESWTVSDASGVPVDAFTRTVIEQVLDDSMYATASLRYLARRESVLAGEASMRMVGDIAMLTGSSTLPAHRRRGIQAALLARRLADARAAGATLAVITTAPGTQSMANTMKAGFSLGYARAILVRAQ